MLFLPLRILLLLLYPPPPTWSSGRAASKERERPRRGGAERRALSPPLPRASWWEPWISRPNSSTAIVVVVCMVGVLVGGEGRDGRCTRWGRGSGKRGPTGLVCPLKIRCKQKMHGKYVTNRTNYWKIIRGLIH